MAEFQLGDRVRYTGALRRRAEMRGNRWWKVWKPSEFDYPHPENRGEGIVVGMRTLANGEARYNGYDEPTTFHAEERFPAVLIAHSLRSKPVFVRVEDVELIDDPTSHDSETGEQ